MFTTIEVLKLILISIIFGVLLGAFILYDLLYRKVLTIKGITKFFFEETYTKEEPK